MGSPSGAPNGIAPCSGLRPGRSHPDPGGGSPPGAETGSLLRHHPRVLPGQYGGGAVPRSLGSNASNRPMPAIGSGLGIWPLQAAPGNGVTHGGIAYPRAAIKCNIFQLFFFIIPALSQITRVPAIAFHPIHWLNNDASIRPY